MRLPNGYGSIFVDKRGNRRKKYRAVLPTKYEIKTDEKGNELYNKDGLPFVKAIRPTLGYYRTRQEALKALAAYNKDPNIFNAQTITFEMLYEMWSKIKFPQIKHVTVNSYLNTYKRCKNLYNIPIGDIKTEQIQKVTDNCEFGYMTQQKIKDMCSQMLEHAIQNDFLFKNYAKYVTIAKAETKIKRTLFTKEEIKKLWENLDVENVDLILIMLYTGLRIGEIAILEASKINTREQYIIGGIKTKAGTDRTIPIADKIKPLLEKRLSPNQKYFLELKGKCVKSNTLTFRLCKTLTDLNMSHTMHETRYTFASLLDEKDVSLLTIKKIMGHAAGNITQDLYTKKVVNVLIEAVNELD